MVPEALQQEHMLVTEEVRHHLAVTLVLQVPQVVDSRRMGRSLPHTADQQRAVSGARVVREATVDHLLAVTVPEELHQAVILAVATKAMEVEREGSEVLVSAPERGLTVVVTTAVRVAILEAVLVVVSGMLDMAAVWEVALAED